MKKCRSQSKALKNKHLHPAKRGRKNRPRAESFEDPDAEQQGALFIDVIFYKEKFQF